MKSLATKLFAVLFVVMLAAGCASSITAPQAQQGPQKITKQDQTTPGDVATSGGNEMHQNVEKPM